MVLRFLPIQACQDEDTGSRDRSVLFAAMGDFQAGTLFKVFEVKGNRRSLGKVKG
jgi:hypothetical protein